MNTSHLPSLTLLSLSLFFPISLLQADEVKLKSGETISGRITYEADDIIKVEIPVTASIKETKVIGRGDIAEIIKDAPDDVEFNRLQTLLPTASLLPASAYRQMLETGPDAFLKNFPESRHTPQIKEIRDTLAGELDKVERGFLKLEGEWLSPQDKIDFKELIESRVRFISMTNLAQSANSNSLIGAMREFEVIEKNYFGSPAYPRAIELAKQIIPTLGRQLQTMQRDVDFRTAEYEKALTNSKPESREQLIQARQREEKAYQDSLAADKKSGVTWVPLNPRIKASIESYLKLASSELARLSALDVATLTKQAEQLVEVDKLIAQNDLENARTKLAEAAALTGQKTNSKSKSKSSSKGAIKGGSSYLASLSNKVNARLADEKSKAEARKAAADSEALTANLNKTVNPATGEPTEPSATDGDKTPAVGTDAAETAEVDDFAALAGTKKGGAKADDKKTAAKKGKAKSTGSSSKKEKDDEEGDDGEIKARPAIVEEEGGFPLGLIVPIITGLLILTVVLLKFFGPGSKKSEE